MNNYIVLDNYRYVTPAKAWMPVFTKSATAKTTVLGSIDVTYGPASISEWQGQIEAPVTAPGAEWGTIETLKVTLLKRQAVTFYDHYGNGYNVHVLGPFQMASLSPKWDNPSSKVRFTVKIIRSSDIV